MSKILSAAVCACLALLLTACGGGGGGGSGTGSTTTPTPSDPFIPSTITVATVLPTYPGGSEELAAYNTLNNARTTCGFGGLNQNTQLDTAAQDHNNYLAVNNQYGHFQDPALAGFTGVTAQERGAAAGYSDQLSFGESLTYSENNTVKVGSGQKQMVVLLSAPYHLRDLVDLHREVGIKVTSSGPTGSGADVIVSASFSSAIRLAVSLSSRSAYPVQRQSSTDVLTYPCAGITGTAYRLVDESPNPVTPRNLATNPIGQPILVQVLLGRTLVITSATVTGPSGPVALLPVMTAANDPNGRLTPNLAMIMPDLPMLPNTSYAVVINGTNNGVAFTRSFSFSTGS
jgi:uncharacterized protein YkwD